jgi:fatty acid synthase, animal type
VIRGKQAKVPEALAKAYQTVAEVSCDGEVITLLRHTTDNTTIPTKTIKVTSDSFEWLEPLKESLSVGPVLTYAEGEPFSGIIGLVNCIRKEAFGRNLKCLFIDDENAPKFDSSNEFYRNQLKQGLTMNVFRDGQWGSFRHLTILHADHKTQRTTSNCFASCLTLGDLSSLKWLSGPYDDQTSLLVRVQYASLNFRDVMMASGKLRLNFTGLDRLNGMDVPGLEFSGVTKDNRRVMGLVRSGAMATHVKADEHLMWTVPDSWSLAEAATVPCVYATVYYAFFITTKVEKGKSILIHSGSGGVGLAAIQVAFACGLEVFTTVGSEEKKSFLLENFPLLKPDNIGNSRDTSFEEMISIRTNGEGVDYVLNSLADDKLQASIRCLKKKGKFIEIGKFDILEDSKIGLGHFKKEISFHAVLLDEFMSASPAEKQVCSVNFDDGFT